LGRALLRDAIRRTLQAADIAGIRAIAVHAKDDAAKRYYEQFDFAPSPTDPLHLFVLLKDLHRIIELESRARTSRRFIAESPKRILCVGNHAEQMDSNCFQQVNC